MIPSEAGRNRRTLAAHVLLASIIIAGAAACEGPQQKQVVQPKRVEQPKGNEAEQALNDAKAKIQGLSAQLQDVTIENQRLKARNDLLESQDREMQPLIRQLVAGYGTGIWDYGEKIDYPVFIRSMKGANAQEVIAGLNERFRKFGQPGLSYEKKEDRTVFIRVDNEEQLDEQMGSNGALSYMTSVVYSLTSVKGVDCVYFDIGEGDHAGPGKYCSDNLAPITPE
jgi:hypothetical protein